MRKRDLFFMHIKRSKRRFICKNPYRCHHFFSKCHLHFKHFLFEYVFLRLLNSLHSEQKWNIIFLHIAHLSGFLLVNWNPTVLLVTDIFFSRLIYDILWAVAPSSWFLSHTAVIFSRCGGLAWPFRCWTSGGSICILINITF